MERGADGFHHYYSELFGDRWDPLVSALHAPRRHIELGLPLTQPYYLDPASVAVATLLPLDGVGTVDEPGEVVDLCSAPGGKALVILTRLAAGSDRDRSSADAAGTSRSAEAVKMPRVILNERSARRRRRLLHVADSHLPPKMRTAVTVYGHDAARWGLHRPERADAVLADVPCSTEAHVLNDEGELSSWSRRRIGRNVAVQHAILAAAIDAARPGGYILYATCALTPEENDDVVAWALDRRTGRVEALSPEELVAGSDTTALPKTTAQTVADVLAEAESTVYGVQILPDRAAGAGPMYCAGFRKSPSP